MKADMAEVPREAGVTASISEDSAGLSEVEAQRRLAQFGENALTERHASRLEKLLGFFWGPIP